MKDFELYYWPLPFRGQFIRAALAFAGKSWNEHDEEEITALMKMTPEDQPVPFMGPPLLIDNETGFALSQMPAIMLYLGEHLELVDSDVRKRALAAKLVNDANDIIDELTLDGGRQMWTEDRWADFAPRLEKWMHIWEAVGTKNGLEGGRGFMLQSSKPDLADIVTATLWGTMASRFGGIASMLAEHAPETLCLVQRLQAHPTLAALEAITVTRYGDAYCGGDIEKSLRAVVPTDD
ncbi:glutathione S-transferase [Sphingobium yanoikuyae]|uniref:glutathione S-transferase n=1 Tax=Sphingobium yanoikuyae TaxID=13690 RepID=UPI0035B292DC